MTNILDLDWFRELQKTRFYLAWRLEFEADFQWNYDAFPSTIMPLDEALPPDASTMSDESVAFLSEFFGREADVFYFIDATAPPPTTTGESL